MDSHANASLQDIATAMETRAAPTPNAFLATTSPRGQMTAESTQRILHVVVEIRVEDKYLAARNALHVDCTLYAQVVAAGFML
jgi:hypothetical protein